MSEMLAASPAEGLCTAIQTATSVILVTASPRLGFQKGPDRHFRP